MRAELEPDARGLVFRTSPYDFADTLVRVRSQILAHNATVFALIDHAAGAASAGLHMPPTTVIIFGNPAVGTPVMLAAPDVALELPSRLLVRQAGNTVEVVYAAPAALAVRYDIAGHQMAGLSGLTTIVDDALQS